MTREFQAPLLQINIYKERVTSVALLLSVYEYLHSSGVTFIRASASDGKAELKFNLNRDFEIWAAAAVGLAGYEVNVDIGGWLLPDWNPVDRITFGPLWTKPDHSKIVKLITSGMEFSQGDTTKAYQQGSVAWRKFVELCEAVDPLYAALTVEYDMESPDELLDDDSSYAFSDCYVAHRCIPEAHMKNQLINDASYYFAEGNLGSFVSSTSFFCPLNKKLCGTHSRNNVSIAIAKSIAAKFRQSKDK